jgi:hypothetical protein
VEITNEFPKKIIQKAASFIRHCAFIVHASADTFHCYVFHAQPSAAPLARTIEAACKLRYQRVLDAYIGGPQQPTTNYYGGGHVAGGGETTGLSTPAPPPIGRLSVGKNDKKKQKEKKSKI